MKRQNNATPVKEKLKVAKAPSISEMERKRKRKKVNYCDKAFHIHAKVEDFKDGSVNGSGSRPSPDHDYFDYFGVICDLVKVRSIPPLFDPLNIPSSTRIKYINNDLLTCHCG